MSTALQLLTANFPAPVIDIPHDVLAVTETPRMQAYYSDGNSGTYSTFYTHVFNGEKNLGEMGPLKSYLVDHVALRARFWELYLTSEICYTVLRRCKVWVIGNGLKLQAEPMKDVLETEGVTLDTEAFNKVTESRFRVFANSTMCDYAGQRNLHAIMDDAYENAMASDVLMVLRYDQKKKCVKVQLIDGCHIMNPLGAGYNGYDFIGENGNVIRHGVELDKTGRHVAYWVRTSLFEVERIEAYGKKSGLQMARLIVGQKYRLDGVRGIPVLSPVMESARKMERYKEATLGKAEELAKVAYALEHTKDSTGEALHGAQDLFKTAIGRTGGDDGLGRTAAGEVFANKVAASTNKQVFNLPVASTLATLQNEGELYFKDFYTVNINLICACLGIPPNVAMMMYDSNFSASRAALKDWEHSLNVRRKEFADQSYQFVYDYWLHMEILTQKVIAPGYLAALLEGNDMVLAAYRNCRFVGANVPHIDPMKEVLAERAKLGVLGANLPLTTLEAATEALNGGDAGSNVSQYSQELEEAESEGIERVIVKVTGKDTDGDGNI